jgi:CheY-like chemotaxis protein
MPNGGRLAIETSEVCLDDAYSQGHSSAMPGAYVLLSVTDTGTGMTEEVKARLFEAFFTTKPLGKGTGLGLATCQRAIRQSGGHIDVSSQLGEGTTFKIYFPTMRQSPLANVGVELKTTILNDRAETILLVEDEPAIRRLVQKVLIAEGYNVLIASNGQEAIRVADEYRGDPISLVLSDLNMPLMDGKGMAERLRTKSPGMKILFTSGFASDEFVESEAFQTGAKFLLKPFTTSILVRNVRQMLNASH